jgi:hypothetical protein
MNIFVTANVGEPVPARIGGISRSEYLTKPFIAAELSAAVRKALAQ